jgi:hypothetical protein
VDDVLSRWPDLPTHRGVMPDIVMWHYVANAWMHCVYVAMGIGTLILFYLVSNCCIMKIMWC